MFTSTSHRANDSRGQIDRLEGIHWTLHKCGTTGCGKVGPLASWSLGGDYHPQPGNGGVIKLKPREALDDFGYSCGGDEEGKVFLVHGTHGESEWCCNVRNCAGYQWSVSRAWTGKGEESGYEVMFSEEARVDEVPSGTRVH